MKLPLVDSLNKEEEIIISSTTGTCTAGTESVITTTDVSVPNPFLTSPIPLTAEEQRELEVLKKDFLVSLKKDKLDIFKALPSTIRQFSIDIGEWENCSRAMNNLHKDMSPRLQELEHKEQCLKSMFRYVGYASLDEAFTSPYFSTLPADITLEDLKIAHLEATLEESMTDNESN